MPPKLRKWIINGSTYWKMSLIFYWICTIMKIYIIWCVPEQIPYLGNFLFLRYGFLIFFGLDQALMKLCVAEPGFLEKFVLPSNSGKKQEYYFLNLKNHLVTEFIPWWRIIFCNAFLNKFHTWEKSVWHLVDNLIFSRKNLE